MLTVTLGVNEKGDVFYFEAEGHLNYAPKGADIACAGASAVILTCVKGCREFLKVPAAFEMNDGYLYMGLPEDLDKDLFLSAQLLLKTMIIGLEEISGQYPKRLKIIRKTV